MFLKPRPILISLLITALFVAGLFATPALATVYVPSATVSSVNLLAGTSASVLTDFYYNLSALPATASVKVQFSKDNTNWYSSTGSAGAWDTISTLGGATLPLSGFVSAASWSAGNAFYYKMQLNSTSDQSQTPTVSGIRLDYTASSGYENKFVFSSAGFVGIGTTNPATLLHLAGFNPAVSITSTNLTQTMSLGIDSGGNNYIWPKTGAFGVYNNAGNAFNLFLNSGGSLGVGTSNPQYLLDVAGSGNFANPVFVGTPTADGHAATKSYVDSAIATATGTIGTSLLWSGTAGGNIWNANGANNVGIGTTNPGFNLEINGSFKAAASSSSIILDTNGNISIGI